MQDKKPPKKPLKKAPRAAPGGLKRRPSSGRPRKLTHEGIIDAAEALVRESGSTSLTMRSLSAKLGVQAPTLYTYFRHLDEIESAAIERIFGGISSPDLALPRPLTEQVVDLFAELRNLQQRNPKALTNTPGSVTWKWSVRTSNHLLRIYDAMGADRDRALLVHRVLSGLAIHSALNRDIESTPEELRERRRLIGEMPAAEAEFVQRVYRDAPLFTHPNEAGLRAVLQESIRLLLPAADKLDAARIKALSKTKVRPA